MAFLVEVALTDKSRTTVKQLLHDRFISVNEEPTTQWDKPLSVGDVVTLHAAPLPTKLAHKLVDILWQDEHFVMIHKLPGIPTVRSGVERDKTVMEIVSEHLKKFNPRTKVFLLNRIDKDSAGFVLMAKNEDIQAEMTERWDKYVQRQQFAVVIEGHLANAEGLLLAPAPPKENKSRTNPRSQGGLTAGEARYRTLATSETGTLLTITLQRGRNNRLRRQFTELSRPIIGDWRNGSKRKDLGYVALETTAFSFVHPITGRKLDFDQPIPSTFRKLLKADLQAPPSTKKNI